MHVSYECLPIITYHERPKCVILNVTDSISKNQSQFSTLRLFLIIIPNEAECTLNL
jgi:hypothetical protein